MKISHIVAAAKNRAIGKNNQLLWHLPDDFKFFKEKTLGHPIIMGRKTFESIGRPLPGRTNIIVSRDTAFEANGCLIYNNIDNAIAQAKSLDQEEILIIGGADLFKQTMHLANRIYYTEVDTDLAGDVFFPEIQKSNWKLSWEEHHQKDEKHAYSFTFKIFDRKA